MRECEENWVVAGRLHTRYEKPEKERKPKPEGTKN